MFPNMFRNIEDMTNYLPHVKRLGFNVVWVNPLQSSLEQKTQMIHSSRLTGLPANVSNSIYAIMDPNLLNSNIVGDINPAEAQRAINRFTARAKELEIEPIFDLVMNHVAKTSIVGTFIERIKAADKIKDEYEKAQSGDSKKIKQLHSIIASLFKDLTLFFGFDLKEQQDKLKILEGRFNASATQADIVEYEELIRYLGNWFKDHSIFEDCIDLNYNAVTLPFYTEFWQKFINRYMDADIGYGFSGVRIDYAHSFTKSEFLERLRSSIYQHVYSRNPNAVILDEVLFSKGHMTFESYVAKMDSFNPKATHITGSAYFYYRNNFGDWCDTKESNPARTKIVNDEQLAKAKTVQSGVIHFPGNHDRNSAARVVLQQLAEEKIVGEDKAAAQALKWVQAQDTLDDHKIDSYKKRLAFPLIQQMVDSIQNKMDEGVAQLFAQRFLERLGICALTGSAGYYLLSGDELACWNTPSVFQETNESSFYEIAPDLRSCLKLMRSIVRSVLSEKFGRDSQEIVADDSIDAYLVFLMHKLKDHIKDQESKKDKAQGAASSSAGQTKSKGDKTVGGGVTHSFEYAWNSWHEDVRHGLDKNWIETAYLLRHLHSMSINDQIKLTKQINPSLLQDQFEHLVAIMEKTARASIYSRDMKHELQTISTTNAELVSELHTHLLEMRTEALRLAEDLKTIPSLHPILCHYTADILKGLCNTKPKPLIHDETWLLANSLQNVLKAPSTEVGEGMPLTLIENYIQSVNKILQDLPEPDPYFWSTSFYDGHEGAKEHDLTLVVRRNTKRYEPGRTDIIILNTAPWNEYEIDATLLSTKSGGKKTTSLAAWLADRGIANKGDRTPADEELERAQACACLEPSKNNIVCLWFSAQVSPTEELTKKVFNSDGEDHCYIIKQQTLGINAPTKTSTLDESLKPSAPGYVRSVSTGQRSNEGVFV